MTILNNSSGENDQNAEKPLRASRLSTFFASWSAFSRFACLAAMIALSIGLINFNKWLMSPNRFPHAVPLVFIHMIFSTVFAGFLRIATPSLFPCLTDPDKAIGLDLWFYCTKLAPIAVFFVGSLVLSNMAYTFLGVAFIQMIKETNVIWVYVLSLLVALEKLKLRSVAIIVVALVGMALTIHGETNFSGAGFIIQWVALLCECARIVAQSFVLRGYKMDPLSYVLLTSPLCAMMLVIFLMITTFGFQHMPVVLEMPPWSAFQKWGPFLFADSVVAFALNVAIALVLKVTSAMTYCMCQLVKDCCVVIIGVLFLSEQVGVTQGFGFALQLSSVGLWGLVKCYGETMDEHGFIAGCKEAIGSFFPTSAPQAEKETDKLKV